MGQNPAGSKSSNGVLLNSPAFYIKRIFSFSIVIITSRNNAGRSCSAKETFCQRNVLAATKSCGVADILDFVLVISGIPPLNPMTKETAKSQQPRYKLELLKQTDHKRCMI